ncbi:Fic family protein [Undibacterium sp. Ji50W]|uniref:Fic family protein n=1 Tax=Undibacterium sp. Ji50W TaxID=3413041 RepID=UPI003BF33B4F
MFDPFGDYETAGYLRNIEKLKNSEIIKIQEHVFFEANLEDAIAYLKAINGPIAYDHFLKVHQILFGEFYPWSGQDRHMLGVGRLISKGQHIQFEAAELCRRAVEWGLELGNDAKTMQTKPGTVMGMFAWGHPFLDGNGRTMLLVHTELCSRADFSIDWQSSVKGNYLQSLTREIETPDKGILDAYLKPFVRTLQTTQHWAESIKAIPGLDGNSNAIPNIVYKNSDAEANKRYEEFKRMRQKQ